MAARRGRAPGCRLGCPDGAPEPRLARRPDPRRIDGRERARQRARARLPRDDGCAPRPARGRGPGARARPGHLPRPRRGALQRGDDLHAGPPGPRGPRAPQTARVPSGYPPPLPRPAPAARMRSAEAAPVQRIPVVEGRSLERLVGVAPAADAYHALLETYRRAGRDADAARVTAEAHTRYPD